MKLLKSKIFWVNIVSLAIQMVQLASTIYVIDPTLLAFATGALSIILRWLQGAEFTVGNKTITL